VDTNAFMRDGYAVVRGAFGEDTARACREMIWDVLAERGIDPDDRATWAPPLIRINCPDGEPFAAAGTSPRLRAAYDELIGAGRWVPRAGVGGTVPVRFPSEDYPGEVGYQEARSASAFQADGEALLRRVTWTGHFPYTRMIPSGTAGRAGTSPQGVKACGAGVRPGVSPGGLR